MSYVILVKDDPDYGIEVIGGFRSIRFAEAFGEANLQGRDWEVLPVISYKSSMRPIRKKRLPSGS